MSFDEAQSLRERLIKDTAVIQSIIDSIPPKYYFDQEVLDQLEKVKVKTGEKESKGSLHKKKFGKRAKHIRINLNPVHQKTVSQIVQELDEKERKDEDQILSPKGNIEELQQRLRKKIQAMQIARHASGDKHAQQVKRNIKKLKQKEKRKKYPKVNVTALPSDSNGVTPKSPAQSPSIFNKEGKLIYSKFDLGASTTSTEGNQRTPKQNLKRCMKELQRKEEKIQKLEEKSTEKAEEVKKKNLWYQALNKSEGRKVKDNPELLKKSLKRQEQLQKKSRKQWQNRSQQVQKKKQDRQDKRTKNIQKRKNDKLSNKLKKASKKGRLIPGF